MSRSKAISARPAAAASASITNTTTDGPGTPRDRTEQGPQRYGRHQSPFRLTGYAQRIRILSIRTTSPSCKAELDYNAAVADERTRDETPDHDFHGLGSVHSCF